MTSKRVKLDFEARPLADQKWLQENTWCGVCDIADLGMRDPSEYAEDGAIYVEGICRRCGSTVRSGVEILQSDDSTFPPPPHGANE